MNEKYDPLDNDATMVSLEQSLGEIPTMRPDGKSIGMVDRYELLEKLGQGGFGAVYGARDSETGVLVALKSLPNEISCDNEEMAEIRDNFALVSRLHHPNIASVLHLHRVKYVDEKARSVLGVCKNDYLVVMEYALGATLFSVRRVLPDQKMAWSKALELCRPIAEALDYAHSKKVLHRDVKPKNIMVSVEGDLKVLDFGLAAEIRSSMSRKSKEPENSKSGTPLYMAPEQWAGRRQDGRADQYALAIIFYELMGGEVPFKSAFDSGNFEIMRNVVLNDVVEPLEELTKKQNAVLQRALAKDPANRFVSCGEFVDALEGKKVSKPRGKVVKLRTSLGRRKGMGLIVGVAVVGLLVGGFFALRPKTKQKTFENQVDSLKEFKVKERGRLKKIEVENQRKVDGFLEIAQMQFDQKEYAKASATIAKVFKFDSENESARKLQDQIEKKIGFSQVALMKQQARKAWEEVRKYDRGQSFGERLDDVKLKFDSALDLFDNQRNAKGAYGYFGDVLSQCAILQRLNNLRNDALLLGRAAKRQEKSARAISAESLSKNNFEMGVTLSRRGDQLFENGRFKDASKEFRKAKESFIVAEKAAGKVFPKLTVVASPVGAKVVIQSLGGEWVYKTGKAEWSLQKGKKYSLIVTKSGYKPHSETVTVDWVGGNEKRVLLKKNILSGDLQTVDLASYASLTGLAAGSREAQVAQKAALSKYYPLEVKTRKTGIVFRFIPAGSFVMGSPASEFGRKIDEGPQHQVRISKPFYCGKFEVTQGQWTRVMGKNPSFFKNAGDDAPVEQVSWDDCQKFVKKLCDIEGVPHGTYRLLTEAEWEYACRAGTSTPFCYGSKLDSTRANFDGKDPYGGAAKGIYRNATGSVGQFAPNAWGLYDMHGNVWEWCNDWKGAYISGSVTDPHGAASGANRVYRGGSWYNFGSYCRLAYRNYNVPSYREKTLGFRLLRRVPLSKK